MKVLVVKLDGLGDWVIFDYYLQALAQKLKDCEFDLLVDSGAKGYIKEYSSNWRKTHFIRHRGGWRFKLWRKLPAIRNLPISLCRTDIAKLQSTTYDLILVSAWNVWQEAFIRTQIIRHLKYGKVFYSRDSESSFFSDFRGDQEREFLLRAFNVSLPKLHYSPANGNIKKIFLFARSFKSEKRWPSNYFVELASYLLKRGFQVELWGASLNSHPDYFRKGGMRELLESLESSDLYIGNDTGILHIAIQLKKKVFVISNGKKPNSFLCYDGKCLPGVESTTGNINNLSVEQVIKKLNEIYKV